MSKTMQPQEVNPPQTQDRPGLETEMTPVPETAIRSSHSNRLRGKNVLITGGDSGIGKAVALLYASEGANIAIGYLNETEDALETRREIELYDVRCKLYQTNLRKEYNCEELVNRSIEEFGHLDILVNNIAVHWEADSFTDISTDQLLATFETNVFSYFWVTKYALPYIIKGGSIINTSSVTAFRGSKSLIDYSATKGAVVAFTRSLALNLVDKGIRVNAVAPGPVWTPLIVSSFDEQRVAEFGSEVPMKRPAQPYEIASSYLFLVLEENSYMTGQVLHPNGGEIINT